MEMIDVKALMYLRGERDGRAGLNPNSTSSDYMKGYWDGRRARAELNLRFGIDEVRSYCHCFKGRLGNE